MAEADPALGPRFCQHHVGGNDLFFHLAGWSFCRTPGTCRERSQGRRERREGSLDGPQRRFLSGRKTKKAQRHAREAALVSVGGGYYLDLGASAFRDGLLSWRFNG